jgi:hypothetical protein
MSDQPKVLVFDVNETLSDTKVLAERFAEVGAPGASGRNLVRADSAGRFRAYLRG